jgi:hypothetical protein
MSPLLLLGWRRRSANRSLLDLAVGTVAAAVRLGLLDLAFEKDIGRLGPLVGGEFGLVGGYGFLEFSDALLEGGFVGRLKGESGRCGEGYGEKDTSGAKVHLEPRWLEVRSGARVETISQRRWPVC